MKIKQFWAFILIIFLLSTSLLFLSFSHNDDNELQEEAKRWKGYQPNNSDSQRDDARIFEVIKDPVLLAYLAEHPYKPHIHAEDEDEEQHNFNSHQDLIPYKIEEGEVEKAKFNINVGVNVDSIRKKDVNINVNVQIDGNNALNDEEFDINVNVNVNDPSTSYIRKSDNKIEIEDGISVNVQLNDNAVDYVKNIINDNTKNNNNNNNDNDDNKKNVVGFIANNAHKKYLISKYDERKEDNGESGLYYADPYDNRIDVEVLKSSLKHFRDFNWEQSIQTHMKIFNETFLSRVPKFIFYNRIGKAGSTSLVSWMYAFSNNFNFAHSRVTDVEDESEEIFFSHDYKLLLFGHGQQNVLERHIHYVNFTKHGYEQPDYINMMRDPASRYISQFYFWRGLKSDFGKEVRELNYTIEDCLFFSRYGKVYGCPQLNYQTAYFCGHDPICSEYPTTYNAYLLARDNMVKYFSLVGTLEYFHVTTSLLMNIYPTYFNIDKLREKYIYDDDYSAALHRIYHPQVILGKKQQYPQTPDEVVDLGNYLNYFDYKLYHLALDILKKKAELFNIQLE